MTHRWNRLPAAILSGLSFLVAGEGRPQSPAEPEVLLNASQLPGDQELFDLACQRNGPCVALWRYGVFTPTEPPVFKGIRFWATTLAPGGGVLAEKMFAEDRFGIRATVAPVGQRFAVVRGRSVGEGTDFRFTRALQWFDRNLEPLTGLFELAGRPPELSAVVQTERIPGSFVQLVLDYDQLEPISAGVFLEFFDDAGHNLRAPVRVNPDIAGEQYAGGLAVDLQAGIITVVYDQFFREDAEPQTDVFCRRFTLTGEPLTGSVRVNTHLPDSQGIASAASTPKGGFVAAWNSFGQDGSYAGVFGRRLSGSGAPVGPEFQVNQVTFSDQLFPQVASNAAGDFVVVWKSFDPSSFGLNQWDIKARLYHADGRPAGPEIYVNSHIENSQEQPRVAFSNNGTFIVAWTSFAQIPPDIENFRDIFARRFSASRADEPCLLGNGGFRCDTGRTGGAPEVVHAFGGAAAAQGFLGDVDGDGRADPCVYAGGFLRCDTDHEGGAAEVRIRFAVDGATTPLLGDMDGDGRADPCLYGGGRFYCDTRHDGGKPELRIAFGKKGEIPLLGDVDGDGRAEACAWADGLFRCDTGHDGGNAEWSVRFGQRGDQPLLGDFDGDGRDDPFVYRQGILLCDTAHDGGAAEGTLALGGPGDRVVLGNLDGL